MNFTIEIYHSKYFICYFVTFFSFPPFLFLFAPVVSTFYQFSLDMFFRLKLYFQRVYKECFKSTALILRKNWAEIITRVKRAIITLEGILYSVYTGCRSLQKALEFPQSLSIYTDLNPSLYFKCS